MKTIQISVFNLVYLKHCITGLFLFFLLIPAKSQVFTGNASRPLSIDSTLLPIFLINTYGQTIPNEPKITAGMKIISHGPGQYNHPGDVPNIYDGKVGIDFTHECCRKNNPVNGEYRKFRDSRNLRPVTGIVFCKGLFKRLHFRND